MKRLPLGLLLFILLVFPFALALPAEVSASPLAQPPFKPVFEAAPCPAKVPIITCGYVRVPESRETEALRNSQTPTKTIRLFTMIIHFLNHPKTKVPLFFLAGGPGEKASSMIPMLARMYPEQDVVTFDQRGIGFSEPSLECPEYNRVLNDPLNSLKVTPEVVKKQTQALLACGQRLRAQGVALEAYNTTESAADVDAIRQALGYEKINLFGVSYGTRLAQEVMRSYSQGLQAVVLDSVLPPSVDRPAEALQGAEHALQEMFAAASNKA